MIAGRRMKIPAEFRVVESGVVGFELGEWDRQAELVIDPVISYSSYLGGSRIDQTTGVAVDAAGAAYVCGWTDSQNFLVLSSIRGFSGSIDAFLAKISPEGTLQWASFIGGSGDDRAFSIGIDPLGNSYLAGYTTSTNFPVLNALQATNAGMRDVFVTKISAAGDALDYSTFWGGSRNDQANSIAIDVYGQAYVTPLWVFWRLVNHRRVVELAKKQEGKGDPAFHEHITASDIEQAFNPYFELIGSHTSFAITRLHEGVVLDPGLTVKFLGILDTIANAIAPQRGGSIHMTFRKRR